MKDPIKPLAVCAEINRSTLRIVKTGAPALELPLERGDDGLLTAACRERVAVALRGFLKRKPWQSPTAALCAIDGAGVSIRRLALPVPAGGDEAFEDVLRLQIENEFPLPPDQLAWGWRTIGSSVPIVPPARREVLVAAVKRSVLESYETLLSQSGLAPVFTLSALCRCALCPDSSGTFAMLNIGRRSSEWMSFDQGVPGPLRLLPWGADQLAANAAGFEAVAASLNGGLPAGKIYLTAETSLPANFARQLTTQLGVECASLENAAGGAGSAAILGLQRQAQSTDASPPLLLKVRTDNERTARKSDAAFRKLAIATAVLLIAALLFPSAKAIVLKPFLASRLARIQKDRERLAAIDHELDFLQYVKGNQPPYLDALYLFSKASAQGSRLDSITMNRKGEISLRGSMRTSQQVTDFRSKLIDSGFFSSVTVEEQTPSPDRQKFNVRMSAQWAAPDARASTKLGPTPAELEQAKKEKKDSPGDGGPIQGLPPGALPPGMMPGMVFGN